MEEVIGIVGFSLGASLGLGLVRTVTGGFRPLAKGVLRGYLAVTDAVSGAVSEATAEARRSVGDLRAEVTAERSTRARTRRGAEPRKIVIAKE